MGGRPCDLPKQTELIDKWDLVGDSEFHQVVLSEEPMMKRRCLSRGNRATHMVVMKATCGRGVIAAEVVFQSA